MKILVIGHVWPEPKSSAAGSRMMQLLDAFYQENWEVHFCSASAKSAHSQPLTDFEITEHDIKMNDSSFDNFIKTLNPDAVVFDRFMVEEQFGWRVAENCPDALRILDTEDLHGLRKGREAALKAKTTFTEAFLHNDHAKREIASIYRCDLTLIISEFEMELLDSFFKVPKNLLLYLPFMVEAPEVENWKSFDDRKDFVFIGNFIHEPNWLAVRFLKEQIWPELSKQVPDANLKIYGAYASAKVNQLHKPNDQFYIEGRAEDALETIGDSRVLLCPVFTGAGLKGKLLEAMQTGAPSVTTSIGAEGMHGDLPFNGYVKDDITDFISAAAQLYNDKNLWQEKQQNATEIINQRFLKSKWQPRFIAAIQEYKSNLNSHRKQNFTGAMLQHQSLQAAKFMGKWIEEKNK